MNKKAFKILRNLRFTLSLINKYKKSYLIGLFILSILLGILPYISLLISQGLMNNLQIETGNFQILLTLLIMYFVVTVCQLLISSLYSFLIAKYSDYLFTELNILFIDQCSLLSYQDYENPKTYDILTRAEQQIGVRPINMVKTALSIMTNTIGFISALLILSSWHLWTLIGFILLPIISYKYFVTINIKEYNTVTQRTNIERKSWYLSYLMIKDYYIKEVKSLNISDYLTRKYAEIKRYIFKQNITINKRKSIFTFLYQFMNTLFSLFVVVIALFEAFSGKILIGNFMTYVNTASKVESSITTLTNSFFSIYTDAMYSEHLMMFFQLVKRREKETNEDKIKIEAIESIKIENLSYKYKNSKKYALKDVNLEFNKGKKYVLVGENGSGKTTLIKILNGLYPDYEGKILINGIDFKKIDKNSIREKLAVIYQDFNNYEFNVKENIGLGDVNHISNFDSIKKAAHIGGAEEFIDNLPYKFDQQLGNWFPSGVQLSGGQWQKIAISRALMKNADIYFFDEPTASLDPSAEFNFFNTILRESKEKIIVFVTHRFTNTTMADSIVVLKDGKVIEIGNHDELIDLDKEYAKLYKMQINTKDFIQKEENL